MSLNDDEDFVFLDEESTPPSIATPEVPTVSSVATEASTTPLENPVPEHTPIDESPSEATVPPQTPFQSPELIPFNTPMVTPLPALALPLIPAPSPLLLSSTPQETNPLPPVINLDSPVSPRPLIVSPVNVSPQDSTPIQDVNVDIHSPVVKKNTVAVDSSSSSLPEHSETNAAIVTETTQLQEDTLMEFDDLLLQTPIPDSTPISIPESIIIPPLQLEHIPAEIADPVLHHIQQQLDQQQQEIEEEQQRLQAQQQLELEEARQRAEAEDARQRKEIEEQQRQQAVQVLPSFSDFVKLATSKLIYSYRPDLIVLTSESRQRNFLSVLQQLPHDQPHILELGMRSGHSAAFWLFFHPTAHVTVIDPTPVREVKQTAAVLAKWFPGRITFLQKEWAGVFPLQRFHLVHLNDGNYDNVLVQDMRKAWKYTHPKGVWIQNQSGTTHMFMAMIKFQCDHSFCSLPVEIFPDHDISYLCCEK